jgi:hypothetical protein
MKTTHTESAGSHVITVSASYADCGDNWVFSLGSGRGYDSKHEAKCKTLALIERLQKELTWHKTQLENF